MKILAFQILSLQLISLFASHAWGEEKSDSMVSGAFIVVEKENPISFLNASGEPMEKKVEVGSVLEPDEWALSGKGGKLSLLLSNGTLVTLLPNTKMKLGDFNQIPFEPGDLKVSDLKEEPSSSQVSLDLDFGALVVKTKKLNKKSSFEIVTQVGTAGIRGTEFQIGSQPESGMQLDVTESTVEFTPPGGSATPVSQGTGLDFSGSGSVIPRAVNPVVAQGIAAVTASASIASDNISLSAVSDAMDLTALETGELGDGSEQAEGDDGGSDSIESQDAGSEDAGGQSGESPPASVEDAPSSTNEISPGETPMIDSLLESDADAKQTRETGKVSKNSKKMAGLPFSKAQLDTFYGFSDEIQSELLSMEIADTLRLLDTVGFTQSLANKLFSFRAETQSMILKLEDSQLISLLNAGMGEDLILSAISLESVDLSHPKNIPNSIPDSTLDQKVLELGDILRASGNTEIFAEIEEMNNGTWTESWIEIAKTGNLLVQDFNLASDWENLSVLESSLAMVNPFYESISTLYNQLLFDQMDAGMNPSVIGGKSFSIASGMYDFSQMTGDKTGLLLGASESLSLDGTIEFIQQGGQPAQVVVASGGTIEVTAGTNLKSALSDLVVSVRQDILLQEVTLESAREVAIRSLRDLQLQQVSVNAADQVRFRASRNLDVDGLQLSQSLPKLIMEATTIRLRNLDFPSATSVQLNSLKGAIDGKYPNFGTGISLEQQLGRVNFIENVSSGGNLIQDRPSFDQFGGNISIGKFLNP